MLNYILYLGGEGVGKKSVTRAKNSKYQFLVLTYKEQSRQPDHDGSMVKSKGMVKVLEFCFLMDFDCTTLQLKHHM